MRHLVERFHNHQCQKVKALTKLICIFDNSVPSIFTNFLSPFSFYVTPYNDTLYTKLDSSVVYLGLCICPLGHLTYPRHWMKFNPWFITERNFFLDIVLPRWMLFCPFQAKFDVSFVKDGLFMATHPMSPAYFKTLLTVSTDIVVVIALSSWTCRAVNIGLAVDIQNNFFLVRRFSFLNRSDFRRS